MSKNTKFFILLIFVVGSFFLNQKNASESCSFVTMIRAPEENGCSNPVVIIHNGFEQTDNHGDILFDFTLSPGPLLAFDYISSKCSDQKPKRRKKK